MSETALRIVTRYEGPEDGAADVESLGGADVIIRIEPVTSACGTAPELGRGRDPVITVTGMNGGQ